MHSNISNRRKGSSPGPDTLTVVVISHNTCDYLRACLASIRDESPASVVVVDNASTDGSPEMVRRQFPEFKLLVSRRNLGYGPAAALAVDAYPSRFYLLLNSDTRVRPGSIERLRTFLEAHPTVGIAGPRILNPDGSVQWSCFPFPGTWKWFVENDPVGLVAGKIPGLRKVFMRYTPPRDATVTPWVLGAALAIRREALEDVQGFDRSFYMYYEEVDLCYRMQQRGWQTVHVPAAEIYHVGGVSTSKKRVSMLVQNFTSTIYFYRKHYGGIRLAIWLSMLYTKMYFKLWRDRIRLHFATEPALITELREDVAAWDRALSGQVQKTPTYTHVPRRHVPVRAPGLAHTGSDASP